MRSGVMSVILVLLGAAALANGADQSAGRSYSIAEGERIYHTLCWGCHGKYGRGDGPLAPNLVAPPADLTISPFISGASDEMFLKRLKPRSGADTHTPMVLGRVLTDESLLDVVAYLKSRSAYGPGTSISAGRDLYQGICWSCHGTEGDGKGPAAGNLEGAVPRDFTSQDFVIEGRADEVFAIISQGAEKAIHGSKYMMTWGNSFSPQQIRDIIAYLRTFQDGSELP